MKGGGRSCREGGSITTGDGVGVRRERVGGDGWSEEDGTAGGELVCWKQEREREREREEKGDGKEAIGEILTGGKKGEEVEKEWKSKVKGRADKEKTNWGYGPTKGGNVLGKVDEKHVN